MKIDESTSILAALDMNESYAIENKKSEGIISKQDETILQVVQFSRRKPELETAIKS